ncbi:MAG: alpha/beta hydrolase [Proteobacteria bacterium]|nr:alpha/beta hydrolase [Pseudomonadota bacterium]
MMARTVRLLRRVAILVAVGLLMFLVGRVVQTERGPDLEPWHEFVPPEPRAAAIAGLDWTGYLAAEAMAFEAVRREVTDRIPPQDRRADARYVAGSPVYPGRFATDWNRSFILEPSGPPVGAVVLLHGLTDSPYSLRHVALRYRDLGYVAVGVRLPGHGTVPAALTAVTWPDWEAAAILAVREARRRAGPGAPLHLVGYSTGGAVAAKYAMDALDDPALPRPDRIVLISPMVGISAFARFAGLAGLPAVLPAFAKAAWLSILPEFNPFKYNSFPVNAARQAYGLTVALQDQTQRLARAGRLAGLAPVLTFQSSMDFTVSTRAIISDFYSLLPDNGSELVLFDVNRAAKLGLLLRGPFALPAEALAPAAPRPWRLTVLGNTEADPAVTERSVPAGQGSETRRLLDAAYPAEVYSLSHVALPFPRTDGLYGAAPDPADDFGIRLGAVAPHGEVGVLVVSVDSLVRLTWNPFFDYMMGRIEEGVRAGAGR